MRIVAVQLCPYRLAFRRPLETALGRFVERRGMIVLLRDELGHVGRGDAAPLPGFSDESLEQTLAALETATAAGQPLLQLDWESAAEIAELVSGQALPAAAAHALDQALLDILSQQRGVAVWQLLCDGGSPHHGAIGVHALVDGPQAAKEALAKGIGAFKVKVGAASEEQDDAKLAAIRRVCGSGVLIRLDANGSWRDASAALGTLHRFARHAVHSVEQPLPAAMLGELAQLRRLSPVPIAADESVRTSEDLTQMLQIGGCDAVVIKPMLCGGLQTAVEMGNRAAAAGLGVSVTSTLESGVGRFGATHVAAAIEADLWSCGLLSGDLLREDVVTGPEADAGQVLLPSGPGLGCGPLSLQGSY